MNTIISKLLSDTFPNNIRDIFLVFDNTHLADTPGTTNERTPHVSDNQGTKVLGMINNKS